VRLLVPIILVLTLVAACTGTPTPSAGGRPDNTALVLAEATEPAALNPLAGYAPDGSAKIFDGLLEHAADGSVKPVLAKALPEVSADGKSWTITIPAGIKFSNGAPLTVADVLATYRALLDPVVASPLRARYSMLTAVDQVDAGTVRFDLAYPYAPFPQLLTLGILPATSLTPAVPVGRSPIDTKPIGTGPYVLASWTKGRSMVLTANPTYFGGAPKVKRVTVEFAADDATRAADLRAGKLDGAAVSPEQAATFAQSNAFNILTDPSSDLRAITLPAHAAATSDPAVRLALNLAVNRASLVTRELNGHGSAAITPMPTVLPEFIEPDATLAYDPDRAENLLQTGGWLPGPDGIRARDGVTAAITLDYPTGDTLDKALAEAFATSAQEIGVKVTTVALPPDQVSARQGADATLISTGDPFDPDLGLYNLLDSTSGGDPTGYADPAVDTALNTGRHSIDPAQRAVAYRAFQRAYLADPAMVTLAFTDHFYVMRANWNGYQQVVDANTQDTTWGPWWNLNAWVPK
jgi:peptide/nickel transport system substrate-binding protein